MSMLLSVEVQGVYSETVYTKAVFQYSKDVYINFTDYPPTMSSRVRISNSRENGNAVEYLAQTNPVAIPDGFFTGGNNVYVWFESESAQTLVVIPVMPMAAPVPLPDPSGGTSMYYDDVDENLIFDDNSTIHGDDTADEDEDHEDQPEGENLDDAEGE